jgi:predicted transcriptional regulator
MREKLQTVIVFLPPGVVARATEEAQKRGCSRSAVLREAITAGVRVVSGVKPAKWPKLSDDVVQQADELAWLKGTTRAEVLREAVTLGLARQHAWRERNIAIERHQAQRRADETEAVRRAHERNPERFDGVEGG